MRILVCGGREYDDRDTLFRVLDEYIGRVDTIIHGGAGGVDFPNGLRRVYGADMLAGEWAKREGLICREYRADWAEYGPSAGPIRNAKMLADGKPDLVIAAPGGKGTADMVAKARAAGVEVRVIQ